MELGTKYSPTAAQSPVEAHDTSSRLAMALPASAGSGVWTAVAHVPEVSMNNRPVC
jgi:hypothetical protein